MEISDWINRFYGYFSGYIKIIESLNNPLYQKLSYVSILDALSQARPKKNNRPSIVSLISSYSGWSDKDRVSIVQLSLHLDYVRKLEKEVGKLEKEDSKLYEFVHGRLPSSDSGHVSGPDVDPFSNEVIKMALKKEKKLVKLACYTELFYAHRNSLVHGFKGPGTGIETDEHGSTPYYYNPYIGNIGDKDRDFWRLIFPVGLFNDLCKRCLDRLKEDLLKENINPYKRYEFGEMWTDPKKLFPKGIWEFFEWFKEKNE